jgi:signal transduction histidine kinase
MAEIIQKNSAYERQITVDVAHELRTPLMAMQANLEAMIDGVMPSDIEHLLTVNSEVVRLGRLVEGQLKLSRLQARKIEINPRRVDLGELITRLMSNYILLVESSGLTLEFKAEEQLFITADIDLIRQAAANLLSNAVRYTPEGGSISVLVQRQDQWVQIVVQDTGIGISETDQDHIFNRFWRATDDRNRDHGGLGIGLAMVREIVEMHGGKITVKSELEQGSKFTIALPVGR